MTDPSYWIGQLVLALIFTAGTALIIWRAAVQAHREAESAVAELEAGVRRGEATPDRFAPVPPLPSFPEFGDAGDGPSDEPITPAGVADPGR
jgi:hypothetical protein